MVVVIVIVRVTVSVRVFVVVSWVVLHRLLVISAMSVVVAVVCVVSLALAGLEMIVMFPELVIFLHERANLGPISALVGRAFPVHRLGRSTGDRCR